MATSRKLLWLRRIGIALALLFVAIQFYPVDRGNPPVRTEVLAPDEVRSILRRACYDCHSHETTWPWYSYVAPASWFVASHVEHGRGDLNLSDWPVLDFEAQDHALHDIREQIEKNEMPLRSYLILHPGARLTEDERQTLIRWAGSP